MRWERREHERDVPRETTGRLPEVRNVRAKWSDDAPPLRPVCTRSSWLRLPAAFGRRVEAQACHVGRRDMRTVVSTSISIHTLLAIPPGLWYKSSAVALACKAKNTPYRSLQALQW